MKPALLVIDIQNAWLDASKELRRSVDRRVGTINKSIALFRRKNLPVIVIYHTDRKRGPKPGTKKFEFSPAIDVRGTDIKVIKNYPNAFNKTDLVEVLRKGGCDTVFIVGLSASGCALATCLGAIDEDLKSYLVRLLMEKEKMAKSAGNFTTLTTLSERGFHPLDCRYFCLGAHYRTQLAFGWEPLDAARSGREGLVEKILQLRDAVPAAGDAGATHLMLGYLLWLGDDAAARDLLARSRRESPETHAVLLRTASPAVREILERRLGAR